MPQDMGVTTLDQSGRCDLAAPATAARSASSLARAGFSVLPDGSGTVCMRGRLYPR